MRKKKGKPKSNGALMRGRVPAIRGVGRVGERKADRLADDLLVRIVSGQFGVGSILPTESDLAERYRVNRGVVREAIKLLEVHGLVRPVRRRGTVVLNSLTSISAKVLRALVMPAPDRVDMGVLANLLEIREVMDVQLSTLAAARRTPTDLAAMDAALAALGPCLGNQTAYSNALGALMLAIAAASHNVLFQKLMAWHQEISVDLERVFAATRPANEQHIQAMTMMVQLIHQGDVRAVRDVLTQFHQWATPQLLAAAARFNGDPGKRGVDQAESPLVPASA
jgi:DNA-binding FadR family transcriptional regulator